jgi:C4-dicarboxylate-specific signal transduction histidine kinase
MGAGGRWRWPPLLAGVHGLLRQREQRQRAEELLRLGQVARLNTLGELAAGMAHEINQPLTAVLANTQAAQRLLGDDPPELDTARLAMAQATSRRVARPTWWAGCARGERPDAAAPSRRGAARHGAQRPAPAGARAATAQRAARGAERCCPPVQRAGRACGLEQIIHNLLMNALQALEQVPASERRLAAGFHCA